MILQLCRSQGEQTVESLYQLGGFDSEMKEATISLLGRIREEPTQRQVWGLLSMGSIVLLAENVYHSPRYVQFWASSRKKYTVTCLLPDAYRPWHSLSAEANTEDAAVDMVLEAMELSGGWSPGARESKVERTEASAPLNESDSRWLEQTDILELFELTYAIVLPEFAGSLGQVYARLTEMRRYSFRTLSGPWSASTAKSPSLKAHRPLSQSIPITLSAGHRRKSLHGPIASTRAGSEAKSRP